MLYILITALNVILNKLKMKDSNIISFIYSRHDRILYVNLVGNRFKNKKYKQRLIVYFEWLVM
ncbi:hypothetical protein [Staphylococcus aureus]|uniref:hypothetical protein n=1 Tax=Staphylococcus aureus TaxID=1280 RepID=UPI000BA6654E|nr:hypothetical protein [Staphylococcus aureus]